MPDLSADRPLPLPEMQFTEEDSHLVTRQEWDALTRFGDRIVGPRRDSAAEGPRVEVDGSTE